MRRESGGTGRENEGDFVRYCRIKSKDVNDFDFFNVSKRFPNVRNGGKISVWTRTVIIKLAATKNDSLVERNNNIGTCQFCV